MTELSPQDNEKLIADFVSGDEPAMDNIVLNNLVFVYSIAYYMIGNTSDAEDITQETFVKVWKNAKKYRQGQSFRNWISAITRNTALDFLRKRKTLVFSDFENESGDNIFTDSIVDNEPLEDEIFLREENKKVVEEVLLKLSFAMREVIVLRYTSNLTFEEIGKIVDRPLHTVKSQHRRALLKIKKYIAPNYEV